MTTDTTLTPAGTDGGGPASLEHHSGRLASTAHRLTFARVVRSEWIKLVTVRSTLWTLLATIVLMVGIGAVAAATATGATDGAGPQGGPGPGLSGSDPLSTVLAGQTPAVLVLAVLGVVIGAREYGSGLLRTTMTAVPRRWPALLGRIMAFLGLVLPVMLLATLAAYGVGTAVLDAGDAATADWSEDGVARSVLGTAGYLTSMGVLGLALGVLLRSLGAAIGGIAGLLLLVPGLGQLLLPDDWQGVLDYLPSQAATSFTTLDGPFAVETGMAVVTAWVVGAVVAAWIRLVRTDV
jgi:ABC-2 type transport system permease protein